MAKTVIDIDDDELAMAAEHLGTKTKKDTVNAALREVNARTRRQRALVELTRLADDGCFDPLLASGSTAKAGR